MKSSYNKKLILSFSILVFFYLVLITGGFFYNMVMPRSSSITIGSPRFPPFSSDPLNIDAMVQHIVFSSVYSTLVSNYKLGELKGIIADSWSHSSDFKSWTFNIRNGLRFENGEPIDASAVYLNFLRIAFKMKQNSSESGFIEYLVDLNLMKSAHHNFAGVQLKSESVIFNFIKPIPKLVSLISFGLYSIASPNMFDSESGDWKNDREVIASGAYKLTNWGENQVTLKLRDDYPEVLRHQRAFETINIVSDSNESLLKIPHLLIGFSDQVHINANLKFYGPVKSVIRHVRCFHWDDPNHIFHNKEHRKLFRDQFYKKLEELSTKVIRSFLPIQIKGVKEFNSNSVNLNPELGLQLKLPSGKQLHDGLAISLPIQKHFVSALNELVANLKGNIFYVDEKMPLKPNESNADLRLMLTDFLIDSPADDLRFMFLSKHGIRLPDPTGKITQSLRENNIDINAVNAQIWEDAIIWPLTQVALGFWIDPELHIDFSNYNATISPVDFRWIGLKN